MRIIYSVKKHGTAEFEEKKSRFIANVFPITSKEQADSILADIRKQYWDASHNVFAYILEGNISKYSDDGEPQGTSGLPIFSMLQSREIISVLVIVTRYFGGTLLGKGGLIRAYTAAAQAGIDDSEIFEIIEMSKLVINCDYQQKDKLLYFFDKNGMEYETEYTEKVKLTVTLPSKDVETMEENIIKLTDGRISTIKLS